MRKGSRGVESPYQTLATSTKLLHTTSHTQTTAGPLLTHLPPRSLPALSPPLARHAHPAPRHPLPFLPPTLPHNAASSRCLPLFPAWVVFVG
ncbi:hypothetical protein E2C01_060276 [Portunus trituberculatus]|uniref:Uncharacterized protein n=1 Tax=Portunus trituberculatus TaxID=210409 RepID=A0A5B7H0I6_PORTR|nr:hypothetical protein [Portunus trituberculatus]